MPDDAHIPGRMAHAGGSHSSTPTGTAEDRERMMAELRNKPKPRIVEYFAGVPHETLPVWAREKVKR